MANLLYIFTLPFDLIEAYNNAWIFPEWFCKMKQALNAIGHYSAILFLVVSNT